MQIVFPFIYSFLRFLLRARLLIQPSLQNDDGSLFINNRLPLLPAEIRVDQHTLRLHGGQTLILPFNRNALHRSASHFILKHCPEFTDFLCLLTVLAAQAERQSHNNRITVIFPDIVQNLSRVLADSDSLNCRDALCGNSERITDRNSDRAVSDI